MCHLIITHGGIVDYFSWMFNKNTIVVMNTGSPVEMPWIDQCPVVLQAWLPGQENGNALSNLLFGKVNPSGKLPVTFPKRIEDNPSFGYYPGKDQVVYNEGIYVGYRHYETRNVEPLFRHGLSYAEFDYKELECPKQVQSLDNIELNFSIKNIGKVKGKEVVQCYVRDINSSLDRPLKELKAFQKISLLPGESKIILKIFTRRAGSLLKILTWRVKFLLKILTWRVKLWLNP